MVTGEGLKPCPFCDGKAKLLHVGNGRIVKCQGCGTSTSFMAKDPVALWNGRTAASEPKEQS